MVYIMCLLAMITLDIEGIDVPYACHDCEFKISFLKRLLKWKVYEMNGELYISYLYDYMYFKPCDGIMSILELN